MKLISALMRKAQVKICYSLDPTHDTSERGSQEGEDVSGEGSRTADQEPTPTTDHLLDPSEQDPVDERVTEKMDRRRFVLNFLQYWLNYITIKI